MKFANVILMICALIVSVAAAHIFFKAGEVNPLEQERALYQAKLEDTLKHANNGDVHAQYSAGELYRMAKPPIRDYAQAFIWYRKAAEQGSALSQYALGQMYAEGQGVKQNYYRAAEWYRLAANLARHPGAQFALGELYFRGRGVPSSQGLAIEWYRKAANQGHAIAQFILGQINKEGWGGEKNLIEAFKWLSLANRNAPAVIAHNSRNDPISVLETLKKKMSRAQIREGEKALKAWKPVR